MKKLSIIIVFFFLCVPQANARYVKLPDGSFFKTPIGKYENDGSFAYCEAFSRHPNAFFGKAPFNCDNDFYEKFKEVYFAGKMPALKMVPVIQNGQWYLNEKQLSGYAMFCEAYSQHSLTKTDKDFQQEKAFFCIRTTSASTVSTPIQRSATESVTSLATSSTINVMLDTFINLIVQVSLITLLFFLLTIGLSFKNLQKPTQCARWTGALVSSIVSVLLLFKNTKPLFTTDYFIVVVLNFIVFYIIGFLGGFIWRKFRPFSFSDYRLNSESILWEQALAETENEQRDNALWAQCFAEANGNVNVAKATYIKYRVSQLKGSK
jgi:hypothetical protein